MLLFILLSLFFINTPLFGLKVDQNIASYDMGERKKQDLYDFSGEYPHLTDITIDGRRKIHVELLLSGSYPLLEEINYEGGFGTIKGLLTGQFPKLQKVNITSTNADLNLDLEGQWTTPCIVNITGKGDMTINLPKNIGLMVNLAASPFGKLENRHPTLYKKKGIVHKRIFLTPLEKGASPQVIVNIISDRGKITLK